MSLIFQILWITAIDTHLSTISDSLFSTRSAGFYCSNAGGSKLIPTAEATPK